MSTILYIFPHITTKSLQNIPMVFRLADVGVSVDINSLLSKNNHSTVFTETQMTSLLMLSICGGDQRRQHCVRKLSVKEIQDKY